MVSVRPKPIVWPALPADVLLFNETHADEWRVVADDYERDTTDLWKAWLYIGYHPAFWTPSERNQRSGYREITFATAWGRQIEFGLCKEGETTALWLEAEPVLWDDDPDDDEYFDAAPGMPSRNIEYVTATYENLVIVGAAMMWERYGNDREFIQIPELDDKWRG